MINLPICNKCSSDKVVKRGPRRTLNTFNQTYQCKTCGHRFTPIQETTQEKTEKQGAKILFLDIETAPMIVYAFQLKTEYISPNMIISPTYMLSWAAKWAGDVHVMSGVLSSKEAKCHDDGRISKSIHALLCQAHLVVAYNGVRFDFKKLNYRFIVHKLIPPSAYRTIDPIRTLRSQFGFDSNKLDYVNSQLGLERKIETNFQLWSRCMAGDTDALFEMETYNKGDVVILEENYMILRPWMKVHPNMGVYFNHEGEICRVCGSTNLREVLDKFSYTTVGKYSLYRCTECGAESTGRNSELSKEKRKSLVK